LINGSAKLAPCTVELQLECRRGTNCGLIIFSFPFVLSSLVLLLLFSLSALFPACVILFCVSFHLRFPALYRFRDHQAFLIPHWCMKARITCLSFIRVLNGTTSSRSANHKTVSSSSCIPLVRDDELVICCPLYLFE
jgi:hypothetical protein